MVPFSLQHFEKLNDNTPGSGIITHKHIEVVQSTTVVPGFRALGPSTAKSALNPGSALFPRLDLVHFVL